jgi:hypothetical protein
MEFTECIWCSQPGGRPPCLPRCPCNEEELRSNDAPGGGRPPRVPASQRRRTAARSLAMGKAAEPSDVPSC